MAKLANKAFVEAIIAKYGVSGVPVEIGGEWCIKIPDTNKAQQFCAMFGVSGHTSKVGFIACNLREQPYNPQVRF